jgi:hypothetical protein
MRPATFSSPVPDLPRQRVEDTSVVRDALHEAWRKLEEKIVAAGIPEEATVQTMVTIAAEEFARVYGPDLAAEYLDAISCALHQHARDREGPTEPGGAELPLSRTRRPRWSWRPPRLSRP